MPLYNEQDYWSRYNVQDGVWCPDRYSPLCVFVSVVYHNMYILTYYKIMPVGD